MNSKELLHRNKRKALRANFNTPASLTTHDSFIDGYIRDVSVNGCGWFFEPSVGYVDGILGNVPLESLNGEWFLKTSYFSDLIKVKSVWTGLSKHKCYGVGLTI